MDVKRKLFAEQVVALTGANSIIGLATVHMAAKQGAFAVRAPCSRGVLNQLA